MAEDTEPLQAAASGVADPEPDQPAGEDSTTVEPERPRDRISERFAKLTRALSEKDRAIAALQDDMARIRQERATPPPVEPQTPTGKPQVQDYPDYDAYVEAVAGWQAEQKLAERERQAQASRQREAEQTQARSWNERILAAQTKYDDWDEVLQGADVPVTAALRDALLDSEQGAEVLYYLASHTDEARRLQALTPAGVARAIGRIEAKLATEGAATPPEPEPPPTPPPVRPVGTSRSGQQKAPADMTPQEYRAWREKGGGR